MIRAGTVLRQALRVVVEQTQVAGGPDDEPAALGAVTPLPFVGVQANDDDPLCRDDVAAALAVLDVDHVRIDAEYPDLPAPDLAGTAVEFAVLVPEVSAGFLAPVAQAAADLPSGSRVLLHRAGRRTTDAAAAAALAGLLARPDLTVIPGSDAYYADLNRDRPRSDGFLFVQHDADRARVRHREPLRHVAGAGRAGTADPGGVRGGGGGQPDHPPAQGRPGAARRARRRPPPRVGTARRRAARPARGHAWTFGSVHAMTRGGAHSATWHELIGARGLLRTERYSVTVVPAFHALSVLRARRRPRVRPVTLLGGGVVGLLFADADRLVLASQRPSPAGG